LGPRATIGQRQEVPASHFPLFQGFGLPAFQSGTPGKQEVQVRARGAVSLSPGAYDEVRVRDRGTLTFTGGTYDLGDLEVGQRATVVCLAPTVLRVKGQLSLGAESTLGPGGGVEPSDIVAYVEGRNGRLGLTEDDNRGDDREEYEESRGLRRRPRSAQVGTEARLHANLFAPNGTVDLQAGSEVVGSVIARDIILGVRAEVRAKTGWSTPGVVYGAEVPDALAKPAVGQDEGVAADPGLVRLTSYPNPFNPSATVSYGVGEVAHVKLSIYNVLGQQVRVLADEVQAPAVYRAAWDGLDSSGRPVAGGIYFCRLQIGQEVQTSKLLLLR
jgi:hypothetical protein